MKMNGNLLVEGVDKHEQMRLCPRGTKHLPANPIELILHL